MVLIMVSGRAQSGKDTFFQLFKDIVAGENADARVERYAFADELKRIASLNGWMGGKAGEGRSFLIDVGQILRGDYEMDHPCNWVRSRYTGLPVERKTYDLPLLYNLLTLEYTPDPNFWVRRCADKIRASLPDIAVVTDWRFPNEGEALPRLLAADYQTVTVSIYRPNGAEIIDDPSETSLSLFDSDYVINNLGSLDDYRRKIKEWFDHA